MNGSPPTITTSPNPVSSQVPPFLSIETPLLEVSSLGSPRRGAIHGTLNPHLNFSRGSLSPAGPKKSVVADKKEEKVTTSSLDMKREFENGFGGRLDASSAASGASLSGLNVSSFLALFCHSLFVSAGHIHGPPFWFFMREVGFPFD